MTALATSLLADDRSYAQRLIEPLAALPSQDERDALLAETLGQLSDDDLAYLLSWNGQARPSQRVDPRDDSPLVCLMGGRGSGKRLWTETPIPTPSGWTTMGALEPGAVVYDEQGRLCRVLWCSPVVAAPAVRLGFSDGSSLLADPEHQWVTWTAKERKSLNRGQVRPPAGFPENWPRWRSTSRWGHDAGTGPEVRTTAEIVSTLTQGARGDRNHSIPVCGPLEGLEQPIPLDPWVLGVWLGDGDTKDPTITVAEADEADVLAELTAVGVGWREQPSARRSGRAPRFGLDIRDGLKALGVLGAKHVPPHLLRVGASDRLALLQGLMDTDGGWSGTHVEFCNTNPLLAQAVVELARSLGQKPMIKESRATLYGRDCGPRWRVTWTPTVPAFRLPRKAAKWNPTGAQQLRNHHRMIVSATPGPVLPMRCITVDSPNSMYLAGEAMIPTHNTRSGAEAICDRIEADMLHRAAFISRTPGDVRRVMIESAGGFREAAEKRGIRIVHKANKAEIQIIDGGVINLFSAHQPEALRGPEHDTAWGDEFGAWPNKMDEQGGTAFSNLLMGLRLGTHPLGLFTTTPRAVPAVREVVKDKTGLWRIARMATMANAANLAPGFIRTLVRMYGGTRLFAQEVEGLYIEDVEGALWSTSRIEATRIVPLDFDVELAAMTEVDALRAKIALVERLAGGLLWRYVAVDPSFAEDGGGDECGIVVGGVGADRRMYVLGDYSGPLSPEAWGERVAWCWETAECTEAVVEQNGAKFGVDRVLKTANPAMPINWQNARTSKRARAEPVSNLWREHPAQSLASFVGYLPGLEAECTGWDSRSNVSPNRIDALTWLGWACFDHLFEQEAGWSATSGIVLPR